MQTCSNCGASVREGAKFCTTCGTKLNAPSNGESSWVSTPAEAEATQDVNATSTWTWGSPSPEASESAASDTNDDEDNGVVTAANTSENDGESASGSFPEDRSSNTFRWNWNPSATQTEEPEVASAEAFSDAEPSETASIEQPEDVTDSDTVTDSDVDEGESTELATWASSWSDSGSEGDEPEASVTAALAEDVGEKSDPFARVNELLTEIQGLLPSLDKGIDAVTDNLEAARANPTDTSGLRTALEAARDNPRDITTIMDLAGKSSDMLAILDERDRLSAAIDQAIADLK